MPWKGNPTGNYSYSSSGKGLCPSCGKPYSAWPDLQCSRKQLHDPYALENPPAAAKSKQTPSSTDDRYSEALEKLTRARSGNRNTPRANDTAHSTVTSDAKDPEIERDDSPFQRNVSTIPKRPSLFRRIRRRLSRRSYRDTYGYHRRRVRKIHSFLILWIASFIAGFLLVSMNAIILAIVSFFDAVILFIPLFILWWLFHKRIAGKVLGVFLILIFAVYVYQNPASFSKGALVNDLFQSEASFFSSVATGVILNNPGSQGNIQSTFHPNIVSSTTSGVRSIASQSLSIDSQWVASFFATVNSYRSSPLTESQTLDQFAAIRFHTIAANYEITHYGYDQDFNSYFAGQSITAAEEYFYPDSSPSSYASYIQQSAPEHWQGLIDTTYNHFGFYIGNGPVIEVYQPCSAPSEIVGSINQTQQLIQYGCQYTVVTGTYLVIELSS